MYGLPYLHAQMTMRTDDHGGVQISSERTERYCFHTATPAQGVRRTAIHHLPWQLQPAALELARSTMLDPFAISHEAAPLVHYAPAQHVVAWAPVPVT